jgi:hypothetical protein
MFPHMGRIKSEGMGQGRKILNKHYKHGFTNKIYI